MEILGHSQISVTMNTYGHVLPETQQDAVQKLDTVLRPRSTKEKPVDAEDVEASTEAEESKQRKKTPGNASGDEPRAEDGPAA